MAKVKILTAAEAANLVEDGMTVSTNGFVACDLPEELTSALEKRFLLTFMLLDREIVMEVVLIILHMRV